MKILTEVKKEDDFTAAREKNTQAGKVAGSIREAVPRAVKKRRRKEVFDGDYQTWRQELL